MTYHRVASSRFLLIGVAIAGISCHAAIAPATPAGRTATLCYHLVFGAWKSVDRAPFATAPVGLVSPLPDTIALLRIVTTFYGQAYYVALRAPADSAYERGIWREAGRDTVILELPSALEVGVRIVLVGSEDNRQGRAWVQTDAVIGSLTDAVHPAPWADVTAARVRCPAALAPPPGA